MHASYPPHIGNEGHFPNSMLDRVVMTTSEMIKKRRHRTIETFFQRYVLTGNMKHSDSVGNTMNKREVNNK